MPDTTPEPPGPEVVDMWTVYENPADYPGEFVARRWVVFRGRYGPTTDVVRGATLEQLQDKLNCLGRTWLPRMRDDDPQVLGVWL